ncbi:hypothetical protein BH24ACT22_BH24ACT22_04240 [soil metagenome]
MASPPAGAVVLVRFPFSDLTRSKLRPAVVLADSGLGDTILCQVTSNPYADQRSIELTDVDFEQGSLQRTSYVRPGKLFTASESLIVREVGTLSFEAHQKIVESVIELLRSGLSE